MHLRSDVSEFYKEKTCFVCVSSMLFLFGMCVGMYMCVQVCMYMCELLSGG